MARDCAFEVIMRHFLRGADTVVAREILFADKENESMR
jgi:hypothetical protein